MTAAPSHDPFAAFAAWFAEAEAHEPDVPDAMQIATVDPVGRPRVRTVLLKDHGPDGFVFYTNLGSRKGRDLAVDPRISAVLHWKSLQRQVKIDGRVESVSAAEADAYFASRIRGSQLGAWASLQSEPLDRRGTLEERLAEVTAHYQGKDVPRPPGWSGFRIVPHRVELWQGREDRLHDRVVFDRRADGGWTRSLRYP